MKIGEEVIWDMAKVKSVKLSKEGLRVIEGAILGAIVGIPVLWITDDLLLAEIISAVILTGHSFIVPKLKMMKQAKEESED